MTLTVVVERGAGTFAKNQTMSNNSDRPFPALSAALSRRHQSDGKTHPNHFLRSSSRRSRRRALRKHRRSPKHPPYFLAARKSLLFFEFAAERDPRPVFLAISRRHHPAQRAGPAVSEAHPAESVPAPRSVAAGAERNPAEAEGEDPP